jgi:hypothetical protein
LIRSEDHVELYTVVGTTSWIELQVCKVTEIPVTPDWNAFGYTSSGFDCCGAGERLEIK